MGRSSLIGAVDPRLAIQEKVLGVISTDGLPIAFPVESLLSRPSTRTWRIIVDDVRIVKDGGGFRVVGSKEDLASHEAFWFAWSQFHPDTVVWAPNLSN